jgi:AmmeMemoRadiSam system protein A
LVIENAYNAAFMDTRFSPVIKTEFEDLNIEISVLSIPEKIDSYNNIVLGKHGIILKCGVYEAVFLPQVALENNWNLETTLMHLSFKASGTSDLWQKENTEFFVFEAEIINESEHLI